MSKMVELYTLNRCSFYLSVRPQWHFKFKIRKHRRDTSEMTHFDNSKNALDHW